jgi:hypothetical protein
MNAGDLDSFNYRQEILAPTQLGTKLINNAYVSQAIKPFPLFTFFSLTVFTVSLVIIGYLFMQNEALKSELGFSALTVPGLEVKCNYQGKTLHPGENTPSGDGCNFCICNESGKVSCTLMTCEIDENTPVAH